MRLGAKLGGLGGPSFRFLLLLLCALLAPARAAETNAHLRDPSTIVQTVVQGRPLFWVCGTGRGIPQFSSPDALHWTPRGPALPLAPAWVKHIVPGNEHNFAWAPDLAYFGGQWHLYYCYSTFGSKMSGIGVATCRNLGTDTWQDGGIVIQSGPQTDFNAIDPCAFADARGQVWLSLGSYFSGIKLLQISPATGKPLLPSPTSASVVTTIAARPGSPDPSIEGSAVTYHDGWYYLFVNFGRCCAGPASTYSIRMGRSRAPVGPYLDKAGRPMTQGGGSLFLPTTLAGGALVGPGHFGILHTNRDYVSFHAEWTRDQGGATTLNILPLVWDKDGWPRAVLPSANS